MLISPGEKLGSGAEFSYYALPSGNGAKPDNVIGIPNWFGRIWQTQGAEFLRSCQRAYRENGLNTHPARILEDITIDRNRTRKHVETAIETTFLPEIETDTVKFHDFIDPEMIRQFMEIVRAADKIYHRYKLGLDPYGGKLMPEVVICAIQRLTLLLANIIPIPALQNYIRSKIKGIPGQTYNIIKQNGHLVFTDVGMHDFSKTGKFKPVTLDIHYIMFASLIEILRTANRRLPEEKQIPDEEIAGLPFNGSTIHRIIAKTALAIMIPVFERCNSQLKNG